MEQHTHVKNETVSSLTALESLSQPAANHLRISTLTERMNNAISALASDPSNEALIGNAVRVAKDTLSGAGFHDQRAVLREYPAEFVRKVGSGLEAPVALALETIGWFDMARDPNRLDLSAQYLERAVALYPFDVSLVWRFSAVAVAMTTRHLVRLENNPDKQESTLIGYKIRAKQRIDAFLERAYGVTGVMIMGAEPGLLVRHLSERCSEEDRGVVFGFMSDLSSLALDLGVFFKKRAHLTFSHYAAVTQLEILGFPRPIGNQFDTIKREMSQSPRSEVFDANMDVMIDVLRRVHETAKFCHDLLREGGFRVTQRRALEILSILDPSELRR